MFRRDFLRAAAAFSFFGRTISIRGENVLAEKAKPDKSGPEAAPWPDTSPNPPIDSFVETIPPLDDYYHEPLRPQFHFTSYRGWINDPNGLFYYRGRWNLFFQYQPFSTKAGWDPPYAPFWGWAESDDLLHWRQRPCQFPRTCSGGAAVDRDNVSGLKTGVDDPILLFSGSGVRYSDDGAKSWKPLKCEVQWNADPIVFRDDATGKWFLITFPWPENRTLFHFKTSGNLRDWTEVFTVRREASECPDMFRLPLDGDSKRLKWVFNVGNGGYRVGEFDGTSFRPVRSPSESPESTTPKSTTLQSESPQQESSPSETPPRRLDWGDAYAFQTWRNAPNEGEGNDKTAMTGRTISIAWLQSWTLPGVPFSQQMTFPTEVTLKSFPDGPRVCRWPIREIERLYESAWKIGDVPITSESNPLAAATGDLFDLELVLTAGDAEMIRLAVRDYPVEWRVKEKRIFVGDKPMSIDHSEGGEIRLRLLIDRLSIEVFFGEGEDVLSRFTPPRESNASLVLTAQGGEGRLVSAAVRKMKSIWPPPAVSKIGREDFKDAQDG